MEVLMNLYFHCYYYYAIIIKLSSETIYKYFFIILDYFFWCACICFDVFNVSLFLLIMFIEVLVDTQYYFVFPTSVHTN